MLWLGVPFRTQIDASPYAQVNCGPASLAMVLAAYGLDASPDDIRDYVNYLSGNYSLDSGTSLDTLSSVARVAGLVPLDLYNGNGYRPWSAEMVYQHLLQGHPVITQVKYRALPGHASSLSEFDHYIVIAGLYKGDFIYNDAAYGSEVGYGLLISPEQLEVAWQASMMPRYAVAIGSPAGPMDLAPAPASTEAPPTVAPTPVPTVTLSPASQAQDRQAHQQARREAALDARARLAVQQRNRVGGTTLMPAVPSPPPAPTAIPKSEALKHESVPSFIMSLDQPRGLLTTPALLALMVALAVAGAVWRESRLAAAGLIALLRRRTRWAPWRLGWVKWILFDPRLLARNRPAEDGSEFESPVPACARLPSGRAARPVLSAPRYL
jgi:hypothetical protein